MSTIATTSEGTASADSSTTQRLLPRPSVPRAVVLHGTTCYYRNESLTFHKRDINTIFIGRYMVEREGFQSGFSNDEFYLAHCSALVKTYIQYALASMPIFSYFINFFIISRSATLLLCHCVHSCNFFLRWMKFGSPRNGTAQCSRPLCSRWV